MLLRLGRFDHWSFLPPFSLSKSFCGITSPQLTRY